ncbi:MAG: sulfurtransferase [Vicingaceae bacterium]|jgi:rhodanese-related sulfurtransferase|nr:MAG: sulfurtransferase [Vicingaceae bacterium]
MKWLYKLFGMKTREEFKKMVESGAIIVDVRTPAEYKQGHAKKSINIPLQSIEGKAKELKAKNKPVIVCCASGMRSAQAKAILQKHGIEVYNAGAWNNLNF